MSSTVEAEYCSSFYIIGVVVAIRSLLKELGKELTIPTILRMDATGAIALLQNVKNSSRTKHIDLVYRWCQQHIANFGRFNSVRLHYTSTDMLATDMFTKMQPSTSFIRCRNGVNMGVPLEEEGMIVSMVRFPTVLQPTLYARCGSVNAIDASANIIAPAKPAVIRERLVQDTPEIARLLNRFAHRRDTIIQHLRFPIVLPEDEDKSPESDREDRAGPKRHRPK